MTAAKTPVDELPVITLREAAPYLRRPFTPEAMRFKVQTVFAGNSGCLIVAYIDARLVIERLNRVVPDMWMARYEPIAGTKLAWCHLSIRQDVDYPEAITRTDVGESPKGMSKDLVSDSLKRAAVHFGVGVSTYALPQIPLFMSDSRGRIEVKGKAKPTVALTEHGHVKLREGYSKWLEAHGVARFGEPLDHGDVAGATFDEEPAVEEFAPEPAAPLDDEEAAALVTEIRAAYAEITRIGEAATRELPPERFNAWLVGAQHSHEEMRRLLAHLRERAPGMAAKYGKAS